MSLKRARLLKYGFHNKSFIPNPPLVTRQKPNSSHTLWVCATANPPKVDAWNWATDQSAFRIKDLL